MIQVWRIMRDALRGFVEDDALNLAAALAFYTALGLAPLVLLLLKIAGLLDSDAQAHLLEQVRSTVGESGARAIQDIVESADRQEQSGAIAAVLGAAMLVFSATSVFGQLQSSLNRIWNVQLRPGTQVSAWIRTRVASFGLLLTVAFLLLISLAASTALAALLGQDTLLWSLGSSLVSIGVSTLLFGAMFRVLPDVRVSLAAIAVGALLTAVLFEVGKLGISLYLSRTAADSAYGAAGSLVVVLLWTYYSALILFFGAELTQAYAAQTRRPIVPDGHAEHVHDASCHPERSA